MRARESLNKTVRAREGHKEPMIARDRGNSEPERAKKQARIARICIDLGYVASSAWRAGAVPVHRARQTLGVIYIYHTAFTQRVPNLAFNS